MRRWRRAATASSRSTPAASRRRRPHERLDERPRRGGARRMKPLTFAARSLRREFRHAELATLAAALVLAVAALCAVATLASRVERAIIASAAELIGGDLSVTASRALPPAFVDEAHR